MPCSGVKFRNAGERSSGQNTFVVECRERQYVKLPIDQDIVLFKTFSKTLKEGVDYQFLQRCHSYETIEKHRKRLGVNQKGSFENHTF